MYLEVICICVSAKFIYSAEVLENGTRKNSFFDENKVGNISAVILNGNVTIQNKTIETERIIQPILTQTQSQTQQVDNIFITTKQPKTDIKSDFKPSPQLETQYEYNKFPVVPAFPEAKHFNSGGVQLYSENVPWFEKTTRTPTESPWMSKIRFPSQPSTVGGHSNHPYPFYTGNDENKQLGFRHFPTTTPSYNVSIFFVISLK